MGCNPRICVLPKRRGSRCYAAADCGLRSCSRKVVFAALGVYLTSGDEDQLGKDHSRQHQAIAKESRVGDTANPEISRAREKKT